MARIPNSWIMAGIGLLPALILCQIGCSDTRNSESSRLTAPSDPQEDAGVVFAQKSEKWKKERPKARVDSVGREIREETVELPEKAVTEERVEGNMRTRYKTVWKRYGKVLGDMVLQDNSVGKVFPGALVWTQPLFSNRLAAVPHFRGTPPTRVVMPEGRGEGTEPAVRFTHDGTFSDFTKEWGKNSRGVTMSAPRLDVRVEYGNDLRSTLLKAGLSASYWSSHFSASMEDSTHRTRSYAVMSVDQVFYNLTTDTPPAEGVLTPRLISRNKEAARTILPAMDQYGEVGYIRRVSYGRRVLIVLNSEQSEDRLRAALNASAGFGIGDVKVDVSKESLETWSSTQARGVIVGGATDASFFEALTGDPVRFRDSVTKFLANTSAPADASSGVPIAFEVAYAVDDQPFANFETAEFSGTIPVDRQLAGYRKPVQKAVLVTSDTAVLEQGDWEVDSDDCTLVTVGYSLSVTPDRRGVDATAYMVTKECHKGYDHQRSDTRIRTPRTWRIYDAPSSETRKIKNVSSASASREEKFSGKVHGWKAFPVSDFGALRDIEVSFDSTDGNDKPVQGMRATIIFEVEFEDGPWTPVN